MLGMLLLLAVFIFLIMGITYLSLGQKKKTRIPGLEASDPIQGNLPDVSASGGMHEFLRDLHHTYGPIAGFWYGPMFCVTIASPELLKEQANVSDRPEELFEGMKPLITKYSIEYSTGSAGRKRNTAYQRAFSHESLKKRFHILQKHTSELCTKWAKLPPGEHIALSDEMAVLSITNILAVSFGGGFGDSENVLKFRRAYDITWANLEAGLGNYTSDENSEDTFQYNRNIMKAMLHEALNNPHSSETESDMFVNVVQEVNTTPEDVDADMFSVCVGGFHTTTFLLSWSVYFLATNPDIQEKLYKEVTDLVGDEDIPFEAISRMKYLRQFIDETLRCSTLAPYCARVQDTDVLLGGYKVPAGTPVIQAIGVVHQDEKIWPEPQRFDPERFSKENKKSIPSCGFEPFGYAGKRKCPGYRLAYLEASILLGDLVRKFKVNLVEDQVVERMYGLITKPKEEIWITVKERK